MYPKSKNIVYSYYTWDMDADGINVQVGRYLYMNSK